MIELVPWYAYPFTYFTEADGFLFLSDQGGSIPFWKKLATNIQAGQINTWYVGSDPFLLPQTS